MKFYKLKTPPIAQAEQYIGQDQIDYVKLRTRSNCTYANMKQPDFVPEIKTYIVDVLDEHEIKLGDWIVNGVDGVISIMTDLEFQKTFKCVDK